MSAASTPATTPPTPTPPPTTKTKQVARWRVVVAAVIPCLIAVGLLIGLIVVVSRNSSHGKQNCLLCGGDDGITCDAWSCTADPLDCSKKCGGAGTTCTKEACTGNCSACAATGAQGIQCTDQSCTGSCEGCAAGDCSSCATGVAGVTCTKGDCTADCTQCAASTKVTCGVANCDTSCTACSSTGVTCTDESCQADTCSVCNPKAHKNVVCTNAECKADCSESQDCTACGGDDTVACTKQDCTCPFNAPQCGVGMLTPGQLCMCGTEICTPDGNAPAGTGTFCASLDGKTVTCSNCPETNGARTAGTCTALASPACSTNRINTGDFCFCNGTACTNVPVPSNDPTPSGTFCAPVSGTVSCAVCPLNSADSTQRMPNSPCTGK